MDNRVAGLLLEKRLRPPRDACIGIAAQDPQGRIGSPWKSSRLSVSGSVNDRPRTVASLFVPCWQRGETLSSVLADAIAIPTAAQASGAVSSAIAQSVYASAFFRKLYMGKCSTTE